MDYKDFKIGVDENMFWLRAKRDLFTLVLNKIYSCSKKDCSKILVLGVGTGDELKLLNNYSNNIHIIDINEKVMELIPKNLYKSKIKGDVRKLPYENKSFDIVLAFGILEHVDGYKKVISESARVLKDGGTFFFHTAAHQFLFSGHDKILEHVERFNKRSFKSICRRFFSSYELHYWNSILFYPLAIQRLLKRNSKPKLDKQNYPKIVDNVLYKMMSIENYLIKHGIYFPIGMSIYGICMKQ